MTAESIPHVLNQGFNVSLTYLKPMAEIEPQLEAHRGFLDKQYQPRCSSPQVRKPLMTVA
jgi:hypothetical protein